ncbi:MAG: hypothetical protein QXG91_00210 [Candidatus Aenigmatarchaeota archaeon]
MRKLVYIAFLLVFIPFFYSQLISKGENQFNITTSYVFLSPFNNFKKNITLGNLVDFNITIFIQNNSLNNSLNQQINFFIFNGTSLATNIFIFNNSLANATFLIDYNEGLKPGRYIGNVSFFNETNISINITEFLLVIDVPVNLSSNEIELSYNFNRLKPLYDFTSNSFDLWEKFILNSSQENVSLITLIFNDTFYFIHSNDSRILMFNFFNNTFHMNNKTIVYLVQDFNNLDYLNFFSKENKPLKVKIIKSTLNFSFFDASNNCNFSPFYYKFLVCFLDSNSTLPIYLNISNNFDTEYKNVYLISNKASMEVLSKNNILYSSLNNSYKFYLPDFVDEVLLLLSWKDSSSDFNVSIDNFAPYRVVKDSDFNYIEKAYNNLEKNRVYNITITSNNTDYYDISVYFFVNFSLFSINYTITNFTNYEIKTYSLNFSLPSNIFGSSAYLQHILFSDENSSTTILPIAIINNQPNFEINNSYKYLNINLKENIGFNKTIKIPLVIVNRNYTDIDNNLTIISIENSTSLKSSSLYVNYSHDLNVSEDINISSSNSYLFNITLYLDASKQIGLYTDNLKIVSLNGLPEKNFTILITLNLSNQLIVNVINVLNQTILPNSDFNITLQAFYQNNTFVDGLNISNFTVKLERYVYSTKYSVDANVNNVFSNSTIYLLNNSVGNILGGNFTLIVNVSDDRGNFGVGEFKNVLVNESLLTLYASPSLSSFSSATNIPISLTVTNHGLKGESNIVINAYSSGCNIYPSSLTISFINYSSSYSNSSAFIVATQNNSNCYVTINSSNPKFLSNFKETSFSILYEAPSGGQQGGQGQQNQTITYSLEIVEFEKNVFVERNNTNTTIVKVKNPSDREQVVYLNIPDLDNKYFEVLPSQQTIASQQIKNFTVKFNATNLNTGTYALKFLAYSSYANKTVNFNLIVLPSKEEIKYINDTLNNFSSIILEIEKNITELEKKGYNLTSLKAELNTIKESLNNLVNAFNSGNYQTVTENLSDLSNKIAQFSKSLSSLGESIKAKETKKGKGLFGLGIFDIIIISIIIAAIAFLIYLLLPVKTPV